MADEQQRSARVIALPASDFFSPEQALAHVAGYELEEVLIVARLKGGMPMVVNSRMGAGDMLLLAKEAELFAMGLNALGE
ncbi:hypothetical protein [Dongia deserti]|uniref:hypothetical protein n=1 Tax=Dongia deserti TaxID=2268030 RepID=UPI000E645E42|nr:hypothetical protein [Dongia deserti]